MAKDKLEAIQKNAGAARIYFYENTLPWGDNGDRILPSANYFEFVREMGFFQNQDEQLKNAFIDNYPAFVQDERIRLNGMYSESDYPSVNQIAGKFKFKVSFMPLPEMDFRLDLSQTEINNLTKQVENTFKERINAAVKDTWDRIKTQLTHMREKLQPIDADTNKPPVFRNSLVDNLKDIIELLPKLNVTNDANIDAICKQMESLVVDPEKLRTSSVLRSQKADEVNKILENFSDFFS